MSTRYSNPGEGAICAASIANYLIIRWSREGRMGGEGGKRMLRRQAYLFSDASLACMLKLETASRSGVPK